MQRIQNYFHIRNSIAWSCFFREIWVRVVEQGGERERDGLDCFFFQCVCLFVCWLSKKKVLASFPKKRNCISGSGWSPDGANHNEWWRAPETRPLWQILWSNIKWCLASQHWWHIRRCWWHITEIMCIDQNDGTTQRLCACTKTMAQSRMWWHICQWHMLHSSLKCPNTMGNLQNVNLLLDAKKYSTSLTVMKNCTAFPEIGSRIAFEMQLFSE